MAHSHVSVYLCFIHSGFESYEILHSLLKRSAFHFTHRVLFCTLMFISNKQMNCTLVPCRRVHDPRAVHPLLSSPSGQTNCYLDMSATMCTKRTMTRNLQSQEIKRIPPSLVPPFVCKLFVITVVSDFARTIWIVCQEHLSDLNGC